MSDPFNDRPLPRAVIAGAAALVGFALILAGTGRLSGIGTTRVEPAAAVQARDLRFEDRADGAVAVLDAASEREVASLAPGTNGFARSVLRGLARERKRQDIGLQPPFRLTRWADGRLSLEDPHTGRRVDLEAFGPDNYGVFARLLTAKAG